MATTKTRFLSGHGKSTNRLITSIFKSQRKLLTSSKIRKIDVSPDNSESSQKILTNIKFKNSKRFEKKQPTS